MTIANGVQYENWNGESGQRWVADADRRDHVLAGIADLLLAAAAPRPGEAVLDIGCGCGAISLAVARGVAPGGAVLGVDISAVMLGAAGDRATRSGLTNVTFVQADVQTHPFPPARHDLALSRFGTMFFEDPGAAFTNIAGTLSPGGRLCIATWQPLAANDWLAIPSAALLRYGTLPDAFNAGPGMFAQSEPSAVTAVLRSAGFTDIGIQPVSVPMHLGETPESATDYFVGTGIGRAVLPSIPDDRRPVALNAVRDLLAGYQGPGGVQLGAGVLVTTASVGDR